ncbi:hypothetical protein DNH61_14085 [Paenibacillus sambharensis]|uniref:Uncharacterized protein n=1 Tax=Paenibacillus sambharensis TaxID=1803190 RepID=A0A2W1LMI1_9BACL|nr:hypothetical protein DNH61_14085 [Paenibacillus sambharensis]
MRCSSGSFASAEQAGQRAAGWCDAAGAIQLNSPGSEAAERVRTRTMYAAAADPRYRVQSFHHDYGRVHSWLTQGPPAVHDSC